MGPFRFSLVQSQPEDTAALKPFSTAHLGLDLKSRVTRLVRLHVVVRGRGLGPDLSPISASFIQQSSIC